MVTPRKYWWFHTKSYLFQILVAYYIFKQKLYFAFKCSETIHFRSNRWRCTSLTRKSLPESRLTSTINRDWLISSKNCRTTAMNRQRNGLPSLTYCKKYFQENIEASSRETNAIWYEGSSWAQLIYQLLPTGASIFWSSNRLHSSSTGISSSIPTAPHIIIELRLSILFQPPLSDIITNHLLSWYINFSQLKHQSSDSATASTAAASSLPSLSYQCPLLVLHSNYNCLTPPSPHRSSTAPSAGAWGHAISILSGTGCPAHNLQLYVHFLSQVIFSDYNRSTPHWRTDLLDYIKIVETGLLWGLLSSGDLRW